MISIKSPEEIEIMREGGLILAEIMDKIVKETRSGVATKDLNILAENTIHRFGGKPSFKGSISKGFGGFPAAMCISINEEIVHGIPSDRLISDGDIVSLDLGIFYKGFHTDMAVTVGVGKVTLERQRLIKVTKKALKRGIKVSRVGNTFGDISNTMFRYSQSQGFNIVRELCGHGIGRKLHEDPQILNYGKRHSGMPIKEGMTFCIEPMITEGEWRVEKKEDGQCFVTKDRSRAAHFEHTIAVSSKGPEILTRIKGGSSEMNFHS